MRFLRRGPPSAIGSRDAAKRLIGLWYGRVNDEPVALDFKPDGRFAYVALSGVST
jgi:hypothetical protein